ncbi:MAG: oxaloacetate decarboxylase subunit alpha [Fusobacterium perfoetens]|uniref:oxaloacetate decarboxylase subunit alpha n=1 Tax=Fusobacterium perfoetens TaxID=852 RepID=UPI0023EFE4E0|nr:oxaloacetate decarboxylase subunit alpha [Fusobacterium perfoetens]MCI6152554.1 oxaloacetate decarboxylase subunit alpha [Fusobacterium perfoetens]MDY3237562.1 oxaloacetate decarboxylase subunit alpha [Fusobacterium perfoetens]
MTQLKITETSLRDGAQSLIATRLTTEEILPIIEKMDQAGFYSMEVWGGATFDSCIRFLNEDPWERLRAIRAKVKNTKLQMLIRGQNLLGYRHYSDDVVEEFVKKSLENGIDIIRAFDALNDFRNLETTIKAIKKYKGHCQGCIAYTTSEVHTIDYYVKKVKELEKMGVDSICIKDMAGILLPDTGYDLITAIKENCSLPLELHTHCTSGIAQILYANAIEAGVDIIDTAMSPFSGGTSQPATEVFAEILKDTERDPKLNMEVLGEVADYLKGVIEKYRKNGILNPKVMETEPKALVYQVPGGMLSNLMSQLSQQNAMDKYEEVLREIPRVRKDLGYPPLVTPMSQMVGTQAVFNVLLKQRYKVVPKEIKDYVRGLYGKSPAPIDKEIQKIIIGDEVPSTCRPADKIAPELEKLKGEIGSLAKSMEDVLSYALFPEYAKKFLENRGKPKVETVEEVKKPIQEKDTKEIQEEPMLRAYRVNVNGKSYEVEVEEIGAQTTTAPVQPKTAPAPVAPAPTPKPEPTPAPAPTQTTSASGEIVEAPMPGTIVDIKVKVGDSVKEGDLVAVIEAMKMETDLYSTKTGIVKAINAAKGTQVNTGDAIITF